MRLDIVVALEAGGTVSVVGEDLNAEGVHEVFTFLEGYTVEATSTIEGDD